MTVGTPDAHFIYVQPTTTTYSVSKYKIPDLITNINFSCIDKNRLMAPHYLAFV